MRAALPQRFLSHAELDTVIRLAPLVAIDLIIRNARDEVLLGLRNNEPAKGCYLVPGGMILKNERLAAAFARLLKNETDYTAPFDAARLIGVFEHFYETNRFGNDGYGTHYVVLGYELRWPGSAVPRQDHQHSELCWWPVAELLASDRVMKTPRPISACARRTRYDWNSVAGSDPAGHSCLDDDLGSGAACPGKAVAHADRDLPIIFGMHAVRRRRHHRRSAIGFFTNRDVERHFPEKRNAEPLGFAPRTAMPEYVRARAALRADKCAHVFDNAQHGHVDAAKHGNATPGVDQGEILRR